jgi:hypothetical protein
MRNNVSIESSKKLEMVVSTNINFCFEKLFKNKNQILEVSKEMEDLIEGEKNLSSISVYKKNEKENTLNEFKVIGIIKLMNYRS